MVFNRRRKGQAAIEFLMTYGWMLLVVLIVGALIFSFVDFGTLLPNQVELSNNLRGDATGSVAYSSNNANASLQDRVKMVFRYNGANRVTIDAASAGITTDLGGTCVGEEVQNIDTNEVQVAGSPVSFLNGHEGILTFDCSSEGLISGDNLQGDLRVDVLNPRTDLAVPSTGSMRLRIVE